MNNAQACSVLAGSPRLSGGVGGSAVGRLVVVGSALAVGGCEILVG
jgi:hypothetical protein